MSLQKTKGPVSVQDRPGQPTIPTAFSTVLEKSFGFKPTIRTITYMLKRIDESGHEGQPHVIFQKLFTKRRVREFKTIFREILNREAFEDDAKRNLDAINAVNFALSDETQGTRVAKEGLKAILRWKKERSD